MPNQTSCPTCGHETTEGFGRCQWCGSLMARAGATPRAAVTAGPVYPERTFSEHHAFGTKFLIASAIVLFGVGGFVVFGMLSAWGPLAFAFSPLMMIAFGICPLFGGILCLAVAMDLAHRAKAARVCDRCQSKLELISVVQQDSDDPDAYREYHYRCTGCGREKVLVDA